MRNVRMKAEFVSMEKSLKADNFQFAERTSSFGSDQEKTDKGALVSFFPNSDFAFLIGCRMRIMEGVTKQPCKSRTFS